jgi:hypothetical protein
MGRSKLKTLTETTLNTFFEQARKLKITDQYNYNAQKYQINFYNGSQIILKDLYQYPSDLEFDSLGSLEITGAFIDEVNQVTKKAFQVVRSRCRYKLNEFGKLPKVLGSCNPSKGWIYKDFYRPKRDKELPISRAFIQALPTDNPHLPPSYLESLLNMDDVSKQRLYYGNWEYDDDPAKLIEYDKIIDLWKNSHVSGGEKVISADIARFGSDKGIIIVWDGFRVLDIAELDIATITTTAQVIKGLMNKYGISASNVIADEDGVGGGVVDILGCKGFVNNSRPFIEEGKQVQYQNLKSQCYFHLAEMVNNSDIFIGVENGQDRMIEELEQVKRDKIDSDGKLTILAKDKVKELLGRSPDYSDALMMRMWFKFRVKGFVVSGGRVIN